MLAYQSKFWIDSVRARNLVGMTFKRTSSIGTYQIVKFNFWFLFYVDSWSLSTTSKLDSQASQLAFELRHKLDSDFVRVIVALNGKQARLLSQAFGVFMFH